MKKRELEGRICEAFYRAAPDFPEAVYGQCPCRKESVIKTAEKRHIRPLRALIIAAALIVALAATVTAVSFSGLIDPETALAQAKTYIVSNETDPALKAELAEAIIGGMVYDESFGAGEADLGLKNGRIVYSISFNTCGYCYDIVMDAKTGVVYSADRAADAGWEEIYPELAKKRDDLFESQKAEQQRQEQEMQKELDEAPDYSLIRSRFNEYFGLNFFTNTDIEPDPETRTAICTKSVDGYIYTATVSYDGSVISNPSVAEDPGFKGERILHEKVEGIISYDEADRLAEEAVIEKYPDVSGGILKNFNVTCYYDSNSVAEYDEPVIIVIFKYYEDPDSEAESFEEDAQISVLLDPVTGEATKITRTYGFSVQKAKAAEYAGADGKGLSFAGGNSGGEYTFENKDAGVGIRVVLDPETLELISLEEYDCTKNSGDERIPNQTLSGDAPDGLISEAAAAAVALENSGLTSRNVSGLTCRLEGNVYKISFLFGYMDYPKTTDLKTNTYEIDAATGEIFGFEAVTPEDFLTEEEAADRAREIAAERGGLDGKAAAELEACEITKSDGLGSSVYSVVLKFPDGRTDYFRIDALTGQDMIPRS